MACVSDRSDDDFVKGVDDHAGKGDCEVYENHQRDEPSSHGFGLRISLVAKKLNRRKQIQLFYYSPRYFEYPQHFDVR